MAVTVGLPFIAYFIVVPVNIYNQIVYTNTRSKLRTLKKYL